MSSWSRFKSWPYIVQCHTSENYAEYIRIQYHLYCRKSPAILFHRLLLLKFNIPSSFKNLLLSKTLFINFKQSIVQFEKDSNRNLYYYLLTAMAIYTRVGTWSQQQTVSNRLGPQHLPHSRPSPSCSSELRPTIFCWVFCLQALQKLCFPQSFFFLKYVPCSTQPLTSNLLSSIWIVTQLADFLFLNWKIKCNYSK